MAKLQSKTSGLLATFIIGLIIISFMFTGYDQFTRGQNEVASVNGKGIKTEEYQKEYQRLMGMYQAFYNGGKPLSEKQAETFQVRQTTLDSLIYRKLTENLADQFALYPSPREITDKVRDYPYFKENEQFSFSKYKALLEANGLRPAEFESMTEAELKGEYVKDLFSKVLVSKGFQEKYANLEKRELLFSAVKISNDALVTQIPVASQEIETYLKTPDNAERLKALFETKKAELTKPLEVKARHILLTQKEKESEGDYQKRIKEVGGKLTPKNFSEMAKKNTDEEAGKATGGDLGKFGKGRMVPEFEQAAFALKKGQISGPVKTQFGTHYILLEERTEESVPKYETLERGLAQELIQREKAPEALKKLKETANAEVEASLKKGDMAQIQKLKDKYKLEVMKDLRTSVLTNTPLPVKPTPELVQEVFKEFKGTPLLKKQDEMNQTVFYRFEKEELKKDEAQKELLTGLQGQLSSQFQRETLDQAREKAKIKKFVTF